jgi:hypothetical protein
VPVGSHSVQSVIVTDYTETTNKSQRRFGASGFPLSANCYSHRLHGDHRQQPTKIRRKCFPTHFKLFLSISPYLSRLDYIKHRKSVSLCYGQGNKSHYLTPALMPRVALLPLPACFDVSFPFVDIHMIILSNNESIWLGNAGQRELVGNTAEKIKRLITTYGTYFRGLRLQSFTSDSDSADG